MLYRRGVALSAAAGVTEEEWAAAVRLGAAGGAAKAFLFGHPPHSPGIAVAAAAAGNPTRAAAAPHGRYIELQQQQDQQQEASTGNHVQDGQGRQQQNAPQQEARTAESTKPTATPVISAETRQVARDALAAVAAAGAAQPGSRQQRQGQSQAAGPKPLVR